MANGRNYRRPNGGKFGSHYHTHRTPRPSGRIPSGPRRVSKARSVFPNGALTRNRGSRIGVPPRTPIILPASPTVGRNLPYNHQQMADALDFDFADHGAAPVHDIVKPRKLHFGPKIPPLRIHPYHGNHIQSQLVAPVIPPLTPVPDGGGKMIIPWHPKAQNVPVHHAIPIAGDVHHPFQDDVIPPFNPEIPDTPRGMPWQAQQVNDTVGDSGFARRFWDASTNKAKHGGGGGGIASSLVGPALTAAGLPAIAAFAPLIGAAGVGGYHLYKHLKSNDQKKKAVRRKRKGASKYA